MKKGNLLKWTNYFNGWQQRYFVLSNGVLSYYHSLDDVQNSCKGSIKVSACEIIAHPTDPSRMDIIVPSEAHFYLRTPSPFDRQEWLVALGSCKVCTNTLLDNDVIPNQMLSADSGSELRLLRSKLKMCLDDLRTQVNNVKMAVKNDVNIQLLEDSTTLITVSTDSFLRCLEECFSLVNPDSQSKHLYKDKQVRRLSHDSARHSTRVSLTETHHHQPQRLLSSPPSLLPPPSSNVPFSGINNHNNNSNFNNNNTTNNNNNNKNNDNKNNNNESRTIDNKFANDENNNNIYEKNINGAMTNVICDVDDDHIEDDDDNVKPRKENDNDFKPPKNNGDNNIKQHHNNDDDVKQQNAAAAADDDDDDGSDDDDDDGVKDTEAMKNIHTFFSTRSFNILDDSSVLTSSFLNACRQLLPIFDILSQSSFNPAHQDMVCNINKVQEKYNSCSEVPLYRTVDGLVEGEVMNGDVDLPNSCVHALMWLVESLSFIKVLLENLVRDSINNPQSYIYHDNTSHNNKHSISHNNNNPPSTTTTTLSNLVEDAYNETLKSHHGYVLQSAFAIATKRLPSKQELLRKFNHYNKNTTEDGGDKDDGEFRGSGEGDGCRSGGGGDRWREGGDNGCRDDEEGGMLVVLRRHIETYYTDLAEVLHSIKLSLQKYSLKLPADQQL